MSALLSGTDGVSRFRVTWLNLDDIMEDGTQIFQADAGIGMTILHKRTAKLKRLHHMYITGASFIFFVKAASYTRDNSQI